MEGILKRSGVFTSFVELVWMFKEWRQSWRLLEPGSFDIHKNATTSMIVMLCCLEVDIKVSGAGMKTTEFGDCREVSRDDGDTNGVLATI